MKLLCGSVTPWLLAGGPVTIVAGIGIVINSVSALLFFRDEGKNLNVKGAYLHLVADALVSLGTVAAGLLMIYTRQYWIDTAVSLLVMAVIVYGTWGLLRDSLSFIPRRGARGHYRPGGGGSGQNRSRRGGPASCAHLGGEHH